MGGKTFWNNKFRGGKMSNDIYIINGNEIFEILKENEREVVAVIRSAYQTYSSGDSSLPHSTFLRFPNNEKDRIISLIGYLGGEFNVAGMKWIASFPDNIAKGFERASAVLVLNSMGNGRPFALLESSIISANRTAASAALAARKLWRKDDEPTIGLVGLGLINFEILKYINSLFPKIKEIFVYDLNYERAKQFVNLGEKNYPYLNYHITQSLETTLKNSNVLSFATTAGKPYVEDMGVCKEGTVVLNISLRDLSPSVILSANNIVDDIEHVNRAQTSIHLTSEKVGHLNFIDGTFVDLFNEAFVKKLKKNITIFSPFGLGVLDLALGHYVYKKGKENKIGRSISDFFPKPWFERY